MAQQNGSRSNGRDIESSDEMNGPGEVTIETLAAWNRLPELIRRDPSLAEFRRRYEELAAQPSTSGQADERSRLLGDQEVTSYSGVARACGFVPLLRFPSLLSGKLDSDADDAPDADDVEDASPSFAKVRRSWPHYVKISVLFLLWLTFTIILMTKREKSVNPHQISIPPLEERTYWILEEPLTKHVSVSLEGALLPEYYANLSTHHMKMVMEFMEVHRPKDIYRNTSVFTRKHTIRSRNLTEWEIPLVSKELIDYVPEVTMSKVFELIDFGKDHSPGHLIRLHFKTNLNLSFPVALLYDLSPIDMDDGIIYATVVLLGLYIFIIFEIIHRTLAAILASTMSLAILAALDERPSMDELISWINVETLLLLFSMMVLVAIFSETGIFDYLAVVSYRITSGKVWPLMRVLCFFTALLSSLLDNVTTVLLMTPVTIRLCEVMELNPVPILMSMIIFSNIGGSFTPVGDPPNVIIASNPDLIAAGVNFVSFILHMGVGGILVAIVAYFHLTFIFRNINDLRFTEPNDVQELRHKISIWQRAAGSLSSYSKDEDVVKRSLAKKVRHLLSQLDRKLRTGSVAHDVYRETLEDLSAKYPIRDKVLLFKSGIILMFVVCMFFMHSYLDLKLSLGWIALLGAILLLLLADNHNMESILARVEWSTLLFFAALFILMGGLTRLGLIDWIGQQTENIILSVNKESRLAVAILLILWVSAAASSFVDNIPLTTMMIDIVTKLAQNRELELPLKPLVWALAFGACLGGNGTLIGSSANLVCAGVAEQHGYRFTFMQYFKIGFPVMVVSIVVITIYLMVAHVALTWH